MRDGRPLLMNFDTRLRFGCNGRIDVFVERIREEFLAELSANFAERRSARPRRFSATLNWARAFVRRDEQISGDAFVQEIEPAIRLLIFGKGPDSAPLRALAEILGWEVAEVDQPTDLSSHTDARTAAS